MARVRFEDGTIINFEGTPTPQDIDFAYQQVKGSTSPNPSDLSPGFDAEQAIAERQSVLPTFAASTANRLIPNTQRTAEDLLSPATALFRRAQQGALHDVAVQEGYESLLANPALALQRGEPQAVLPDAIKGLLGQRPAQFGDVFQEAGVPGPIAASLGLALNPYGAEAQVQAGKALWNLPGNIRRFFAKTPMGTERLMTLSEKQIAKLPPEERQAYLQLRNTRDQELVSLQRQKIQADYQAVSTQLRQDEATLGKAAPAVARERLKRLEGPFKQLQSSQNKLYKQQIDEALAAIPENDVVFTRDQIHEAIANKFLGPQSMDDPTEYRAILNLFDGDEIVNVNEVSARQILKMADDLSRGIGRAAYNKSRAFTPNEAVSSKLRDVLLDLLEARGANVREAKADWAQWVPIRNLGLRLQTPSGPRTLISIVKGRDPVRAEQLDQLEALLGEPIQTEVRQLFDQMDALTQRKVIEQAKQVEAKRLLQERINFNRDSKIARHLRVQQMARHQDAVRQIVFEVAKGGALAAGAGALVGVGKALYEAVQ